MNTKTCCVERFLWNKDRDDCLRLPALAKTLEIHEASRRKNGSSM